MVKLRTKRFKHKTYVEADRKIRAAISRIFRKGKTAGIKAMDISREAQVNQTTFYAHYDGVEKAVRGIEKFTEKDIAKMVKEMAEQNYTLEMGYMKLLAYVARNKEYFYGAMIRVTGGSIEKICAEIRPFLTAGWSNFDEATRNRIYAEFCGELLGTVWFWGKYEKFSEEKIDAHAKELTRLTKTACERLY